MSHKAKRINGTNSLIRRLICLIVVTLTLSSSLAVLTTILLLHLRLTVSEKLISAATIILTRWASESVALYKLKIAVIVVSKMMRLYSLDRDHSIFCL